MGLCTPIPNKSPKSSLMDSICYNLSPTFGFHYTHITPRLVHYYRHFHSTTHSYPNLMPFFTQHVQMQQIPTFRFYLHRSEPNALFFICVLGLSTHPISFPQTTIIFQNPKYKKTSPYPSQWPMNLHQDTHPIPKSVLPKNGRFIFLLKTKTALALSFFTSYNHFSSIPTLQI